MNDVIFEQDKPLKRPYAARDLLGRALNPHLIYPLPEVYPGNCLLYLLKRQPIMARAQIIEKVAADLSLTLEKRDGFFVFRFPDVWDTKDIEDMQRQVLEGIAAIEARCNFSLVTWFEVFFGNLSAGLALLWDNFAAGVVRLWEGPMFALFAMIVLVFIALLGLFHVLIVKAAAWGFIALFVVMVIRGQISALTFRDSKEEDHVPPRKYNEGYASPPPQGGDATIAVPARQGGGQSNTALIRLMKWTEREINARAARAGQAGPSDALYDEPQVAYPMEMEQEL